MSIKSSIVFVLRWTRGHDPRAVLLICFDKIKYCHFWPKRCITAYFNSLLLLLLHSTSSPCQWWMEGLCTDYKSISASPHVRIIINRLRQWKSQTKRRDRRTSNLRWMGEEEHVKAAQYPSHYRYTDSLAVCVLWDTYVLRGNQIAEEQEHAENLLVNVVISNLH